MPTTNLDALITTVERLRVRLHPDLDAALLEAVVHAEEQNPDDDTEALRDIQTALTRVLDAKGAV